MKYTDGPWDYIDMCQQKGLKINNMDDRFVVRCKTYMPGIKGIVARCGYRLNAELITDCPNLLKLCKESYEALKDIINASGNDQPYSAEELDKNFSEIVSNLYDAIQKHEPDFE